jgi:type IV secretion system protein TrbD
VHVELNGPREIKFHQSANRPNLLMGGDRELVLMSALMAAILVFAMGQIWGIPLGIVIWLVCVAALSRLGKADPMMRPVYLRHIRYKTFYPAKSGLHRESTGSPTKW